MSEEQLRITRYLHEVKDEKGKSLFEHFCQLYDEYFIEKPNLYTQSAEFVDKISQFLKKHSFHYSNPKTSHQVNNPPQVQPDLYHASLLQLINHNLDSIHAIMTPLNNDLLNQAGIGFSDTEAYLLHKALKKLASQGNFLSLRFWGKILTNGTDYYVAECQLLINHEEDLPDDTEKVGTGANEYVHYVIQNLV